MLHPESSTAATAGTLEPRPGRRTGADRCRPVVALAMAAALGGCGGYNDNGCYNSCYNPTPVEFSNGVASADLRAMGRTDVVALSTVLQAYGANPSNLKVYLSTAPGAYAAPGLVAAGDNPLYIVAFNNCSAPVNCLPDVATASFDDGSVLVFTNNAAKPGTFNAPVLLNSPGASQLAVMDMNHDGLPDIVSADFNVSLFIQTAPGQFAAPVSLYGGGANWVALGDLNGDGIPDIALTDAFGVKVLMHIGAASSSTYAAPQTLWTQTANANVIGANLIAVGDLDGDKLNDLVMTDPGPTGGSAPTVVVRRQILGAPGTFHAPESYPIATQDLPQSIVLADLENSGSLDIVIGGSQFVTVLLHDRKNPGKFLAASIYTVPGANEISIGDVNGDHLPDIIVSNGVTNPLVNGVMTTHPGVLLQNAAPPGSFGKLQDLP
jgi:FG-GAP-like repeat